jgi:tetratricopeptide (TPR) repeat protein
MAADSALEIDPSYTAAHFRRGTSLVKLGRDYDALLAFEEVLQQDPSYEHARTWQVWLLMKDGKLTEAMSAVNEAVEDDPGDASARVFRARLYLLLGKPDSAKADLEATVGLDSGQGLAKVLLAGIVRKSDITRANQLIFDSLGGDGPNFGRFLRSRFRSAELDALSLALRDDSTAADRLRGAIDLWSPYDVFEPLMYDAVRPWIAGQIDELLAVWGEIIEAHPSAAPWGGPFNRETKAVD